MTKVDQNTEISTFQFSTYLVVYLYFVHVGHVNTTSYTYPRTGHTNSYMNRILIHNKYIYTEIKSWFVI